MDQTLRMAKAPNISRWRTLRIKVTDAKKDAEANLDDAMGTIDYGEAGLLGREVETLQRVLVWMEQIEEALDGQVE